MMSSLPSCLCRRTYLHDTQTAMVSLPLKAEHNDYIVVCNEEWETTFKQLKKYDKIRGLHPLNAK